MPRSNTLGKPIALFFPPVWDTDIPYLAVPTLTAFLKKHGIEVIPRDLNLEWHKKILSPAYLKSIQGKISSLLAQKGIREEQVALIEQAKAVLPFLIEHSEELKYNNVKGLFRLFQLMPPFLYKQLALAKYAINSTHFPTTIAENRYVSTYGFQSLKQIFDGARSVSDNVFLSYFIDQAEDLLLNNFVSLIGISLSGATQLVPAFTLAYVIKQLDPTIPIVIGGGLIPYMRKALLQTSECFDFANYYVVGEGESALLGLYNYLQNGGDIESVPNLIYRERKTKQAKFTYEYVENVKNLSFPDYENMNVSLFGEEGLFAIQTSRGCWWDQCSFCSMCTNVFNTYREQDMALVIKHMERLRSHHNCQYVFFTDDCFTVARLKDLVKLLEESNLVDKFKYHILCRFESGFDAGLLKRAYATGLRSIGWGLESAHFETLRLMRKGIQPKTAEKCLRESHLCGIWNTVFIVLDFPGAPDDDAEVSLNFIIRNAKFIDILFYGSFSLEYGSHIYKNPQKYNINIIQQPSDYIPVDASYYDNTTQQYRAYWSVEKQSASVRLFDDGLNRTHLKQNSLVIGLTSLLSGSDNFNNGLSGKLIIRSNIVKQIKKISHIANLFDQTALSEIYVHVPDYIQVNFVDDRVGKSPKQAVIFNGKTFNCFFANMSTLQIMINANNEISLSDLVDKLSGGTNARQSSCVETGVRKVCRQLAIGGFMTAKSALNLKTA